MVGDAVGDRPVLRAAVIGVVHDTDEDTDLLAWAQRRGGVAGILDAAPGGLQEQPLLRMHRLGFDG